eukprot:403332318
MIYYLKAIILVGNSYKCPSDFVKTACSPGEYSPMGSIVCTTCPSGYYCPTTSDPPQICSVGTYPAANQLSCTTCPAGKYCGSPLSTSPVTCTAPTFYQSLTGQTECLTCPAGSSCTASATAQCSSTNGYYSVLGTGTCSQSQKGYFTPERQMNTASCPTNTYTSAVGQYSCSQCDSGFSCSDQIGTKTACATGTFSPLGVTTCQSPTSPYIYDTSTSAINKPCTEGYYSTSNACVQCAAGKICSDTATVSNCPVGQYSTIGKGYCMPCKSFYGCNAPASPAICTTSQYLNPITSTCTTCPLNQVCSVSSQKVAFPRFCSPGYYRSSATACTICPEGSYCPDGKTTSATACATKYISGTGYTACIKCPAGYDCNGKTYLSLITKCAAGYYSLEGDAICSKCTTGQICPETNTVYENCIAGTYITSTGSSASKCTLTDVNYKSTGLTSSPSACTKTQFAKYGQTSCTTCPTNEPCSIDRKGFLSDCDPGFSFDSATNTCKQCTAGKECLDSTATTCPKGTLEKAVESFQCLECPTPMICAISGSSVVNNYCYGKESGVTVVVEFTKAVRLPYYDYQYCIDCNSVDLNQKVCTFATNYFTSQVGANLTCPSTRSKSYDNTINGVEFTDYRYWDKTNYDYPFCDIKSSTTIPGFDLDPPESCSTKTFYKSQFSSQCLPTFPGFQSGTNNDHPTSKFIADKVGKLEQRDFGTVNEVNYCPPTMSGLYKDTNQFVQGAASASQGCSIKKPGTCDYVDASDFCHDGYDGKCNIGFMIPTDTTLIDEESFNDCMQCEEGKYCGANFVRNQTCPAGRFCLAVTEDEKQYAAGPGQKITTTNNNQFTDQADCTDGYCPSGSSSEQSCPDGYNLNVDQNAHSQYNCQPNKPGLYQDSTGTTTTCTAGSYCPEAVQDTSEMIPCPPGHYSDSTGLIDKSSCSACPAGKFCPEESTSAQQQNCEAGFYCLDRTRQIHENACPGGTYSSATTNAQSDITCLDCPVGYYCKQGSSAPVVCPKNAYCPLKSELYTDCPVGYYRSSTQGTQLSDCSTCMTNYICPGGTDPIACPAGYNGFDTSSATSPAFLTCLSTTTNYFSVQGTTQSACANGYYTPLGKAAVCIKCERGYYCAGGVRTACAQGESCPEGSSAAVTCPAGSYCSGLQFSTVYNLTVTCPPGKYCPSGSSTPIDSVAGYYNLAGESSSTAHLCGDGYTCPGASTGRFDTPCPSNTFAATGSQTCTSCDDGKYCPIGSDQQFTCPQGYYCDNATPFPVKCPRGTYGASVDLASVDDCTDCPGGYYCPMEGQVSYSLKCDAGYYCSKKSYTPQPDPDDVIEKELGGLCPAGSYCPQGSTDPLKCPAGTYNSFPGMRAVSDCISCTPGYYCIGSNLDEPDGLCKAGYYCPSGSQKEDEIATDPGYYSLEGSSIQIKCEPGTYTDLSAQTTCKQCDAGTYCDTFGMDLGEPCPAGYYCPAGSVKPIPCAVGTYNPTAASSGSGACQNCDAGKYCDEEGLTYVKGTCSAGYFCKTGSPSATPAINLTLSINSGYITKYGICPRGNYCPIGSEDPTPCPIGYYLNGEGGNALSDCVKCQAGSYCDATGLAVPKGNCDLGYYCEAGSDSIQETVCPVGHYCLEGSTNALICLSGKFQATTGQSTCDDCTAGNFCSYSSSTETTCPAGSYCPANSKSADQYLCPSGTFNELTGSSDIVDCLTCEVDKYCKIPGASTSDVSTDYDNKRGLILKGYNNENGGSKYSIPIDGSLCSQGQSCNGGVETPCPSGKYCGNQGLYEPSGDCEAGYFCDSGAKYRILIHDDGTDNDKISICSQGAYCEAGTISESLCPVGTFSSGTGLQKVGDCQECPIGYICDIAGQTLNELSKCPVGKFCNGNVDALASTTTCPNGKYCNQDNIAPQPCDKGEYNDLTDQSVCQTCPLDKYCHYGQINPITLDSGYYQNKTGQAVPIPCPAAHYIDTADSNKCNVCPIGTYCGQYLLQSTLTDRLCPNGYYCDRIGIIDYQTLFCLPGYYCPSNSELKLCTAGSYCKGFGNIAVTGPCEAGYYCNAGSKVPNPIDNVQGNVCPVGAYCVEGSTAPVLCPIGTYNDKVGASSLSFCLQCPDERSCLTEGTYSPGDGCPAGYYCVTDPVTKLLQQFECEEGYKCPAGKSVKQICPPGTYQNQKAQDTCLACTAGSYCYNNGGPIVATQTCPSGYYCPASTALYQMYPCETGSYNDITGLSASTQCKPCDYGKYCSKRGLTAPNGDCRDGRICAAGSKTPQGSESCTANNYCKAGVIYPCPIGTYNSPRGLSDSTQCVQCPPGSICSSTTTITDCTAGYYCEGNVATILDATICPVGNYCLAKSYVQLKCMPGTYQDEQGKTSCKQCPDNKYCDEYGMSTPKNCEVNMQCPAGSILPKPCSIGQYADASNQCVACPEGQYCWPEKGTDGKQGVCEAGYICQSGSFSPRPFYNVDTVANDLVIYNGPALRGYYSTDGKTQTKCAVKTFQPSRWSDSCLDCYAGSYCSKTGMKSLVGYDCTMSTLCQEGSQYPLGELCAEGYTTETGQSHCMACVDGYFSTGSGQCQKCPSGYYCDNTKLQTGGVVQQKCIVGANCPAGSPFEPICAEGKYLSSTSCVNCDIGRYCRGGVDTGICTAGYFCQSGESSPTPPLLMCSANKYCPHGATREAKCPTGYYRPTKGAIQVTDCVECSAGYICINNQVPYECPKGFYCPYGTTSEIPCPIGTWSQSTSLIAANECQNCPSGYLCNKTNITDYSKYPCPKGRYCPSRAQRAFSCPAGTYRQTTGARMEADCSTCPPGYYCPEGTTNPIRCKDGMYCPEGAEYFRTCRGGYYCSEATNYQEEICPTNYKCPRGSSTPQLCDGRLICKEGSEIGLVCSAGSFVQKSEYGFIDECLSCPIGKYSTMSDITCKNCTAGHLCYGETNRKHPTDYQVHHGEICPKGHYCEEGSSISTPCPLGSYNANYGAESINQCLLCPENTFNDELGQSGCRACGAYANSIEGSSTCDCIGNFRSFSSADSSCRCKGGYDYINPLTDQSEGTQSDDTDCTPLVFDRCDGELQTRDLYGSCVELTDCSAACPSGRGNRSETTGVCTCEEKQNVDSTCNQNCRSKAASMTINTTSASTSVIKITINGKTTEVDLDKIGDFYGNFDCSESDSNCTIRSTETSDDGFQGNYGSSSLVESTSKKILRQMFSDFLDEPQNDMALRDHDGQRYLQTSANTNAITNPVFCISMGTSMLFTISDPTHYPVYLKDSVMNSNPSFDYGQFLILETSMKYKIASNNTKASLFAFTFTDGGSYLFADAGDFNKVMLVKVMESGETCSDSDRYIQPLSGESVASVGVSQKEDIIIKPDIPLLVGIGAILIISIGTVMVGVGYCLHKGWSIKRAIIEGYRSLYGKIDINHSSQKTFQKDNDFENYRSHMGSDSEEDDLDNINLDIHQDLIEAGQNYLKVFDENKNKRIQEKNGKKGEILQLMKELEDMISVIGSDAMANQMQIVNQNSPDDDLEQQILLLQTDEDDEQAELKRQKFMQYEDERERKQREAEDIKRQKMMNEWSDRDRLKLKEAQDKMNNGLEVLKKEFNADGNKTVNRIKSGNNDEVVIAGGDDLALALYDGGDPNSRHNQIVKAIENNQNLTEEEKENLLRNHQKQLMQIDDLMDAEKRKQNEEMERALKERIDKRRKALEAKHKKEIQGDVKDQEQLLKEEIERNRKNGLAEIDEDVQNRMDELTNNLKDGQAANYRQWVEELKRERELRKQKFNQQMDDEYQIRLKKLKEDVVNKYTQGAQDDNELENLMKQAHPGMESAIDELKRQKMSEENKLKDKLKQRKLELKKKQQDEKERFDVEIMTKDPLLEEELEQKKNALNNNNNGMDINDSLLQPSQMSVRGVDKNLQQDLDNPKDEAQTAFAKLLKEIDTQTQTSHLLEALGHVDSNLGLLLKDNEDEQSKKLEARRQLLRQRKMLKQQQEQEQERINERLAQLQLEAEEKDKIQMNFVKEMFKKQDEMHDPLNQSGATNRADPNAIQQKLLMLNEFSSDAFLQRLSNLLMKQFLEKESQLKLLLQKYMDQKLIEKNNIKENFKDQFDKLNKLRDSQQISEGDFQDALKNLRLKEENILRDIDLHFDKAMKEEELKLRETLERKHADEQIEIKKREVEDQLKLKKELMLSDESNKKEEQKELDQLKAYEHNKKREVDKKIRGIGVQKTEIMRQIQKDLDNKYEDYEDLLRRKRDEEALLQEQALNIRKKLQDRKKKLKEQGVQEMSQADQKKMIDNYNLQLQALESVFEEEKRRQLLIMKKKQQQRVAKVEKFKDLIEKVEEQELDAIKNELGTTFGDTFFKPGENTANLEEIGIKEDDDELLKRLKEWRDRRNEFKMDEEEKKLAETVIDLDQLTLKKLILKLDNLERCLRELRKIKKYDTERFGPDYFQGSFNNSKDARSQINNQPAKLQQLKNSNSEEKPKTMQQQRSQTDLSAKNDKSGSKISLSKGNNFNQQVQQVQNVKQVQQVQQVRSPSPQPIQTQKAAPQVAKADLVKAVNQVNKMQKVIKKVESIVEEEKQHNVAKKIAPASKFITDPKPIVLQMMNESIASPRTQNSRGGFISGRNRSPAVAAVDDKVTTERSEGKKIDYSQFKKFVKKR